MTNLGSTDPHTPTHTHTHTHAEEKRERERERERERVYGEFNLHKKEPWTERHAEYYAPLIWLNDSDDSNTVC